MFTTSRKTGKRAIAAAFAVILSVGASMGTPALAAPPAAPAAAMTPGPNGELPIKPGDPVVMKINGADIKRSEVLGFINTLPEQARQMPLSDLFPKAQDQVVINHIIDAKAAKSNLESDPEVQQDLAQAKAQIIRSVYVEHQVKEAMTDKKLHEVYDKAAAANKNVEEVRARHILVDSEDKAKDIIAQLDKGADFAKLAQENSKDGSASKGGEIGYFAKGDLMVPELSNAAFALKTGQYSKTPVKTQLGWHVIQVEDRRKRQMPKFDDIKPQLEAAARQQVLNDMLAKWQKDAKVEKMDINGDPVKDKPKS